MLKSHGFSNLYLCDVEDLSRLPLMEKVDIVLLSETIEHLANPGMALLGCKRFMGPDSRLCITTPNALSLKLTLRAIFGIESSSPNHLLMFSPLYRPRFIGHSVAHIQAAFSTGLQAILLAWAGVR